MDGHSANQKHCLEQELLTSQGLDKQAKEILRNSIKPQKFDWQFRFKLPLNAGKENYSIKGLYLMRRCKE